METNVNAVDLQGWTPLLLAGANAHWSTVRLLLRYGANVDAAGADGHTLLHRAAVVGDNSIVRLLMSCVSEVVW